MDDGFMKFLVALLVFAYVVSPVDCAPGPIDDLIVILLAYSARKKSE